MNPIDLPGGTTSIAPIEHAVLLGGVVAILVGVFFAGVWWGRRAR